MPSENAKHNLLIEIILLVVLGISLPWSQKGRHVGCQTSRATKQRAFRINDDKQVAQLCAFLCVSSQSFSTARCELYRSRRGRRLIHLLWHNGPRETSPALQQAIGLGRAVSSGQRY